MPLRLKQEGNGWNNTKKGLTDSRQSYIAASVTSHSCQVWGISAPWHVSNPSYLQLSPPASRQLISPDTSHSPNRESLYPENNPALLPPHPKSVPAPFYLLSVFLIFPFTLSLPIYPFPITSFRGLLFLSCLHLSLSNHVPLLFYLTQSSFAPSFLLHPHFLAGHVTPLLMRICEKMQWLPIEE